MGSTVFSACGFCINIVAGLLVIMAFATPYWIEPNEGKEVTTQLERLGLWEICFASYTDIHDGLGRVYNGCWWIFSRQYDTLRPYIIKGWFATTQALLTLSVIVSLGCILVGLLLLLKCLPSKVQKYAALTVSLSGVAIGLLVGVALYFFGTHADHDQSWLKAPRYRHLSWSFWLAVIGGLLHLLGAVFYAVYFIKIKAGGQRSTAYRAHELRHYRNDRYYR